MTRLTRLSRSIQGATALITGAASGMGRATAQLFADEGAHVAVTDLRKEGVDPVVAEIVAAGGSAHGWTLDVTDASRIREVVVEIVAHFGGLDILVNNAGVAVGGPIEGDAYEDAWQTALDVLLTAQMRLVRASLPHLLRSKAGRIINIASTEALGASAGSSPYTAAKHGVLGLTRGLAVELGQQGITVNCVCPGPIHTGMTQLIPDAAKQKFARRRVPLRRYGDPEEVAHATLHFALPASSYINGAVLPVDGGMTAQNT